MMREDYQRRLADVQKKINPSIEKAQKEIKIKSDFWKAFEGRVDIILEAAARKFPDAEFERTGKGETGSIYKIRAGGIEQNFDFGKYKVHAYSSKGIAGAEISKEGRRAAFIVYHKSKGIARAKSRQNLLLDPEGNALFTYLTALFALRLGRIRVTPHDRDLAHSTSLKLARTMSYFGYLLENNMIKNDEELKAYLETLAKWADVKPVTLTKYLFETLPPEDTKGIAKVKMQFHAEGKKIGEFWEKTAHIMNFEERVEETARLAGITISTCCNYLAAILPKEQARSLSGIKQKYQAASKNVLRLWKENKNANLRERIMKIAYVAGIDVSTCCDYLGYVLSKEERSGIGKIKMEERAKTKNIISVWEKTADIADLEKRIEETAELAGIDPKTCCNYLTAVLPKNEKAGIGILRMKLSGNAKNMAELWESTKNIGELRTRVLATAALAGVAPTTCCNYVQATVERLQRRGVAELHKRLHAESKKILELWAQAAAIADLEARVEKVAELAKIERVTAIQYLRSILPPQEAKKLREILEKDSKLKGKFFHKKCRTLGVPTNGKLYCPRCKEYF